MTISNRKPAKRINGITARDSLSTLLISYSHLQDSQFYKRLGRSKRLNNLSEDRILESCDSDDMTDLQFVKHYYTVDTIVSTGSNVLSYDIKSAFPSYMVGASLGFLPHGGDSRRLIIGEPKHDDMHVTFTRFYVEATDIDDPREVKVWSKKFINDFRCSLTDNQIKTLEGGNLSLSNAIKVESKRNSAKRFPGIVIRVMHHKLMPLDDLFEQGLKDAGVEYDRLICTVDTEGDYILKDINVNMICEAYDKKEHTTGDERGKYKALLTMGMGYIKYISPSFYASMHQAIRYRICKYLELFDKEDIIGGHVDGFFIKYNPKYLTDEFKQKIIDCDPWTATKWAPANIQKVIDMGLGTLSCEMTDKFVIGDKNVHHKHKGE